MCLYQASWLSSRHNTLIYTYSMDRQSINAVTINLSDLKKQRRSSSRSSVGDRQEQPSIPAIALMNTLVMHTRQKDKQEIISEDVDRINKMHPVLRPYELFTHLLQGISNDIIKISKRSDHEYLRTFVDGFGIRMNESISQMRKIQSKQLGPMEVVPNSNNRHRTQLAKYYCEFIREKDQEITRKQKFREYANTNFADKTKKIQEIITLQSSIIDQQTFEQCVLQPYNQFKQDNKFILNKRIKEIAKSKLAMISEIKLIKDIQKKEAKRDAMKEIKRKEEYRMRMANKYEYLEGVLLKSHDMFNMGLNRA